MQAPDVLTVLEVTVGVIHKSTDDDLDSFLVLRQLRKIAVVRYDDYGGSVRAQIGN
jgi:hypothetical protein